MDFNRRSLLTGVAAVVISAPAIIPVRAHLMGMPRRRWFVPRPGQLVLELSLGDDGRVVWLPCEACASSGSELFRSGPVEECFTFDTATIFRDGELMQRQVVYRHGADGLNRRAISMLTGDRLSVSIPTNLD